MSKLVAVNQIREGLGLCQQSIFRPTIRANKTDQLKYLNKTDQ